MLDHPFIDHAFVIVAALIAIAAWKYRREYFLISFLLAADFAIFFGIDQIWLRTDYISPETDILFWKGWLYLVFFFLYLMVESSYLAALSAVIVIYHKFLPIIGVDSYFDVMTVYCILQLFGAGMGVSYDYIYRHSPHIHSIVDNLYGYLHKNEGRR